MAASGQYDVIVIGAGPAGASAARYLARSGCATLLLEKESLGRDKPCGGGLTPRAYDDLDVPIDDLVLARPSHTYLCLDGKMGGKVGGRKTAIWMVLRRDFDRRLAEAAVDAGAVLHEREPATDVIDSGDAVEVSTVRGKYTARAVLIASGAEGRLRNLFGVDNRKRRTVAAIELEGRARSPRLDGSAAVLDFSIPGGYLWAFPKGEIWNVGVGSLRAPAQRQLRDYLAKFLAEHKLQMLDPDLEPSKALGRRIPLYTGPTRIAKGRVALLGDAAGLADPFFAEGIASALVSGRLAAESALGVLAGQLEDLTSYQARLFRVMSRHMAHMQLLARWVPSHEWWWMQAIKLRPCAWLAERWVSEPFSRLG